MSSNNPIGLSPPTAYSFTCGNSASSQASCSNIAAATKLATLSNVSSGGKHIKTRKQQKNIRGGQSVETGKLVVPVLPSITAPVSPTNTTTVQVSNALSMSQGSTNAALDSQIGPIPSVPANFYTQKGGNHHTSISTVSRWHGCRSGGKKTMRYKKSGKKRSKKRSKKSSKKSVCYRRTYRHK